MLKYTKKNKELMKNKVSMCLNGLDLFGQPPALMILKKNKFTTSTGFTCTFAITTICLIYLIYQIKQLYDKEKPMVVFSESQLIDTTPIPLTMRNFTLAITVANLSLASLTTINTHFTIEVQNCARYRSVDSSTGKTKIISNCTTYPTEACSSKHFVTDLQKEYFSTVNLGYTQCLNAEIWAASPPVLQGQIAGKAYQYLLITVRQCKNTTISSNCASQESINKELNSVYYALHMSDNLVQMKKQGSPFEEYISLQYTTMSILNSKTIFQWFKLTNTETDDGLITTDSINDFSLVQSINREQQDAYNKDFLVLHYLNLDQRQADYNRGYIKIQGILGNIGGLYQVLFLTISALLNPITKQFMNLQMANKLFRFEDGDDSSDNPPNEQVLSPNSQQRFLEFDIKRSLGQRSNLSRTLEKIKDSKSMSQFLKQKKQSLNLTLRDIMVMNFGCKRKEKQQIQYATDKFMSKLDVAYLISKIYEIDKLKLILLTGDQQKLFNYLPKPVIPSILFGKDAEQRVKEVELNKAYKFILQDEKSDIVKLQEAFYAYVQLQKKGNLSSIDTNILEILDEDILELFEGLYKDKSKLDIIFNQKLSLNLQISEPNYQKSSQIIEIEDSKDHVNSIPYMNCRQT